MTDTAKDMPERIWLTNTPNLWLVELSKPMWPVIGNPEPPCAEYIRADLSRPQAPAEGEVYPYRHLEEGEIIQEGDEIDNCANAWHDEAKWVKVTSCIGCKAPDPRYPSHRQYRRPIENDLKKISADLNAAMHVINLYFPQWKTDKDVRNTALRTLIQAATRSSQTGAEGLVNKIDSECDAIISRANHAIKHCRLDGHTTEECHQEGRIQAAIDISNLIAAHRKQTEANNEKREG